MPNPTPGEWLKDGKLIYALDELPHRRENGSPVMANRFSCHVEGATGLASQDEITANVNLIWAAKDLLASCCRLTAVLALRVTGKENKAARELEIQAAWEDAVSAIAKAEGR